jgi:hypothetical protein
MLTKLTELLSKSDGLQYGCSKSGYGALRSLSIIILPPLRFTCKHKGKAERVGFEPTRRLNTAYAISSRAPSANSDTSPKMLESKFTK